MFRNTMIAGAPAAVEEQRFDLFDPTQNPVYLLVPTQNVWRSLNGRSRHFFLWSP